MLQVEQNRYPKTDPTGASSSSLLLVLLFEGGWGLVGEETGGMIPGSVAAASHKQDWVSKKMTVTNVQVGAVAV
eukprot:CAMPEP_0197826712 /NCGR_PEP_ID=MMETSP1437-20131217/3627_1 /TAXON_ID=49252 ORGANISM="Eucampia antarctica, Strain CCMP1452" /NCGR_SAMPLE_ID=MMETSP1437 /ASSEMBLY_ACC=CAM_ASM_001096 /LENGTH=73 /DNA_ID=CAMNT_0043427261 /DNA_START=827 /DNA_END=1048 /DNA_ORIENTATION=+